MSETRARNTIKTHIYNDDYNFNQCQITSSNYELKVVSADLPDREVYYITLQTCVFPVTDKVYQAAEGAQSDRLWYDHVTVSTALDE